MNIEMQRQRMFRIARNDSLERSDDGNDFWTRRFAVRPIVPRHRIHPRLGIHRRDVVIGRILGDEIAQRSGVGMIERIAVIDRLRRIAFGESIDQVALDL
jgi:hypothetical protein